MFSPSNVIIQEEEKIQIQKKTTGPHLADSLHYILKQVSENTEGTSLTPSWNVGVDRTN